MNNTETKNPPVEAGLQDEPTPRQPANNVEKTDVILGVSDPTVRRLIGQRLLRLSRDRSDLMISKMEIEPFLGKTTNKTTNNKSMKTTPIRPTHEIRLAAIKAAIWRNETETGTRYNVQFTRLYKQDDKWASTESFGRDDLLLLAKVADQAHSWIHQQEQEESGNKQPLAETPPAQ
jgi:hypothetical protein